MSESAPGSGRESITLYELIEQVARTATGNQRDDGSMPAGHNGLYHDPETPVRNTSHWLVTFSKLYERTDDPLFKKAAMAAASYLQSSAARPNDATFRHRTVDGKDECNGLIGQAWTIEALAVAAKVFEKPNLAALAEEVFLLHPQDTRSGLWKRVEVDGQILPFDATFNHQIWFAAAGGILANLPSVSTEVDDRVRNHLGELETNLRLYPSGLIFHPLKPAGSLRRNIHLIRADGWGRIGLTFLTSTVPLPRRQRQLRWKAIGYHAFNLYAFALLKGYYTDHGFWTSPKCLRAVEYLSSSPYLETVWDNEYGSQFNPVGFEVPYVMDTFGIGSESTHIQWVTKQIVKHYNSKTEYLDQNTKDKNTLSARIYQATRLPNVPIHL